MARRLYRLSMYGRWYLQLLKAILLMAHDAYKTGNWRSIVWHPPGHYDSPIPDVEEIASRPDTTFEEHEGIPAGIDLNVNAQLKLLDQFSRYCNEMSWPATPSETSRYYYDNDWFGYGDAIVLYSVLRHYKPRRIVEIGSGFSSAAMLDVNDSWLQGETMFTFIDPWPERLLSLLTPEDREKCTILAEYIQTAPLGLFSELSTNDILFIDSSHVVKSGSDVAFLLFNVLPSLNAGVLVHIHDVFWPFEYPREWLLQGRAWNEAYFLRAFLQFNSTFEIIYYNDFIRKRHEEILREKLPAYLEAPGCSIWLRKTD
jgi:hypothetical protein